MSLTDVERLQHLAYHVFLPPKLPQSPLEMDGDREVSLEIVRSVASAARKYRESDSANAPQWGCIIRMLECFSRSIEVPLEKNELSQELISMKLDDVLTLYIRAQNTAIIVRKRWSTTVFEAFEVNLPAAGVMSIPGKLVRHYPGPAVEVPNAVAEDIAFTEEIASFLVQMDAKGMDQAVTGMVENTSNSAYFIQLFFGILRGMGEVVDPPRVVKRIADEVLCGDTEETSQYRQYIPWRRSPIWLTTRVAIQTSLGPDSRDLYKYFMAFYHADVLSQCHKHEAFTSDLLYVMRVKMGRRVFKLPDPPHKFVVEKAEIAATGVQDVLQARWSRIQADQVQSPGWDPSSFDLRSASNQTLPNSRTYLEKVFAGRAGHIPCSEFEPDHKPRLENIEDFALYADGALSNSFLDHKVIALFDFESSVFQYLSTWTKHNLSNAFEACKIISSCFKQYLKAAQSQYTVDVADRSIMFLTLMKLWVAIDELATSECSLLRDFSPELSRDILDALLLRTSQHIEAARTIQEHLRDRHKSALPCNPSIFDGTSTPQSFAVQYFQQSSALHLLKSEIERDAQRQQQEKRQELQQRNEEHAQLGQQISRLTHKYDPGYAAGGVLRRREHRTDCERCKMERKWHGMYIRQHIWPLPADQLQAEVVVFELQRPGVFTVWRDVTCLIIHDLGRCDPSPEADLPTTLDECSDLRTWITNPEGISGRVVMALGSEPRGGELRLPAKSRSLFVKNYYMYQLYDLVGRRWIVGSCDSVKFTRHGTLSLPHNSPYTHLAYALEGTTHTSNQVVADQFDCPKELNLHEHIAFGTLRSGPRLQWMNIARGLEENTLTFSSQEVRLLHTQSAWQIGPLADNGCHEWHMELEILEYGNLLVSQSMQLLDRVRANWLEVTSVATVIMLVSRLLASSPNSEVVANAYKFLREARSVTFGWLSELQVKLKEGSEESVITDYRHRVCEMAAICRSTFDVDPRHIPSLLATREDYSLFIMCSIALYENKPPELKDTLNSQEDPFSEARGPAPASEIPSDSEGSGGIRPQNPLTSSPLPGTPGGGSRLCRFHRLSELWKYPETSGALANLPKHLQVLLGCDRRLSHKTLPYLLQQLRLDRDMLCGPIFDLWADYRPSSDGWTALPAPNTRWSSTITTASQGQAPQNVHFDLLEGCLLIDGKPLTQLPRSYIQHPTYTRVFGQASLNVVPVRSTSGVGFTTRDYICGYQVSLWLDDNDGLVIQARKAHQTFELVPFSRFTEDLPELLSADYHHWACLETKTIEFRPLLHPWSDPQWILCFFPYGSTTLKNTNDGSCLIDIHSSLFHSVSSQLVALETSHYLHVTLSESFISQVQVELPRMQLSFFLNEDMRLESANFHNHIVDDNQSAGTLFGLRNQLVLCAKAPMTKSLPQSRSLLIPHGDVEFSNEGDHVLATIGLSCDKRIRFHRYLIDTDLGHLANDASLTSRLYKIYLHAVTSYCLPDPLTGRTGTEEALHTLIESGTSSFEKIEEEEGRLLNLIGSLTPARRYCHKAPDFQTTTWSCIPSLSQHFGFSTAIASIMDRANTLRMFHPSSYHVFNGVFGRGVVLLRRAALRTHWYYSPETPSFLEELFKESSPEDEISIQRDALDGDWVKQGQTAAWAAHLAYSKWGQVVYKPLRLVQVAKSWSNVQDCDFTLAYSSDWLNLPFPDCWITLYNLCRRASVDSNKFRLASCLASATFTKGIPLELLPALVAFAVDREFASLDPPNHSQYLLTDGYKPNVDLVKQTVKSSRRPLPDTPSAHLSQQEHESTSQFNKKRDTHYKREISNRGRRLAQCLLDQWPSTSLLVPTEYSSWFLIDECLGSVQPYFSSCRRNMELRKHLHEVEQALSSHPRSRGISFTPVTVLPTKPPTFVSARQLECQWREVCFDKLMFHRPCPQPMEGVAGENIAMYQQSGPPTETSRLSALFSEFEQSSEPLNRRYGRDLNQSRSDLAERPTVALPKQLPQLELLDRNCEGFRSALNARFQLLKHSLGPTTPAQRILLACGIWPRITPRTLLQRLTLKARLQSCGSPEWQKEVARYAHLFTTYQRSQRLVSLALSQNIEEFWKEVDGNETELGTDELNPDWLLLQIDGNFGARLIQRQVAKEMISPSSESNIVLQLNMGEGKSSVIIPMVAAALADTRRLVRIVVLKSLWRQTFHLLVNRLAGLVNRRIYYLPFGRHIKMDDSKANQLQKLYDECLRAGGVLIVQPEHILSFKLIGISHLTSGESQLGERLRAMQDWLNRHARDVLDESDEILHVRYQLVYTVGEQQPLEDHPDRWKTTQQLLHLLSGHIAQLDRVHPGSFKYEAMQMGQFPFIRIMPHCSEETENELIRALANDILHGHIQNLQSIRLTSSDRSMALDFLTSRKLSYLEYEAFKNKIIVNPTLWRSFLLLRGLLASGILVFALKEKHYRVDYGLDLSRSELAVPFRAKDIPSLLAEFGQPDAAIVLTCLSYYYTGLNEDQLYQCFDLLFKLNNPSLEYEQWVSRDNDIPAGLQQLTGVNMKNREHFRTRITPTFSRNSAVIDFFLSSVVFPKSAKGFPSKLSASAWDLAERKLCAITGFSGTNDNQYLLPTSIKQVDPVNQLSTNALVLTYLLQPENNYYMCICDESGGAPSNMKFLELLVAQTPAIRVLLDVGAQMLELQNEHLVRCWLELVKSPDIQAAVFFNDKDELMVLPRNDTPTLFYSSPFAQQLHKCIVYLDDGHTRGTDLKFPKHARALVTLGPKVTKDRLLQGCMRMRKLGSGQTVMFAAPLEIDSQIRRTSPKPLGPHDKVDVLDVLRWAMLETCKGLQYHVSHWAQQGIEYARRDETLTQYGEGGGLLILKKGWLTPEVRSLEEMYGVVSPATVTQYGSFMQRALKIPSLRDRLNDLEISEMEDPGMDEEQEREVIQEVEREIQVGRPSKQEPATHATRGGVRYFVETGVVPAESSAFTPLFSSLCPLDGWSKKLFASVDFLHTVTDPADNGLGDYMRPVNWIVTGKNRVRVVLSPYEVNELLPVIRQSCAVSLHVYAPRVSETMRSFSDLGFYSVPPQSNLLQPSQRSIIQIHLDIFAGQLYFLNHQEFGMLCALLGLYRKSTDPSGEAKPTADGDGFVKPEHREELFHLHPGYVVCGFTSSPIPMLRELIDRRRKGMNYLPTPMGKLLHGWDPAQDDF